MQRFIGPGQRGSLVRDLPKETVPGVATGLRDLGGLRRFAQPQAALHGRNATMLRGVYNVANAMELAERNHEIASENLVHATTPGYRRQGLTFNASSATGSQQQQTQP